MNLDSLAQFAAEFRGPDAQGRFHVASPAYETEDGYTVFARESLGEMGQRFIDAIRKNGWVLRAPFNPVQWINSEEAVLLRADRTVLASATAEQLAKLLTTLLRQEHFVNGALASAFDSGLLLAIAERAEQLATKH